MPVAECICGLHEAVLEHDHVRLNECLAAASALGINSKVKTLVDAAQSELDNLRMGVTLEYDLAVRRSYIPLPSATFHAPTSPPYLCPL